ncbi:MAG: hypothetical protein HKO90_05890 [Flavobacteriaceae bacterium]|nr:hypothetical protein [Bacteroidia bacterium]NNK87794.1 hypothetical protein [Flavobacteriaceae bacterium]
MTRVILVLVLTAFILSCEKREVQLAESFLSDITVVRDVSPIYVFYDEHTGAAEFNRNNMIGTTNWLVNIDKRLNMAQVYPHLQFLYKKRNGDGMHKNTAARNYFSCSNPELQNLTFLDFTNTVYHGGSIAEFLSGFEQDSTEIPVIVNFETTDDILIIKGAKEHRAARKSWLDTLLTIIRSDEPTNRVYLNINGEMNFQDYIHMRSSVDTLTQDKVQISNHEFIYK